MVQLKKQLFYLHSKIVGRGKKKGRRLIWVDKRWSERFEESRRNNLANHKLVFKEYNQIPIKSDEMLCNKCWLSGSKNFGKKLT